MKADWQLKVCDLGEVGRRIGFSTATSAKLPAFPMSAK
jgi:hypothetical protein